MHTSFQLHTT